MNPPLKIPALAFFGTPDLTIAILDELERAGMAPKLIVTGMDAARGRKLAVEKPAPKVWAEARGIPVLQPQRIDEKFVNSLQKEIEGLGIRLGVVVAYGKILPQALLDVPELGMINVHYSLLPKYRGATPVEAAILNGDSETGVSIQKMAYALDAGDVIAEEQTAIGADETGLELRARLNEIAKKLLVAAIRKISDGTAALKKQDDAQATRCGKIRKEDGMIDPAAAGDAAVMNYRKFRAYAGWPGVYFFAEKGGKKLRIKITDAELIGGEFRILRVVPEGRKEIPYGEFIRT